MADFTMPSLGADMDAGTLLEWRVKPGDRVARGDIVAVVDTDKAAIEIEIFETGTVSELLIAEGEKVPVGTPLARLATGEVDTPDESAVAAAIEAPVVPAAAEALAPAATEAPARAAEAEPHARPEEPARPAAATTAPERVHATPAARKHARERGVDLTNVAGTGRHGVITDADVERLSAAEPAPPAPDRLRISPLARRLAQELGLDLTTVTGTGLDGAITKADVERAAGRQPPAGPAEPAAPPEVKATPQAGEDRSAAMRRAIAAAMSKSKREIPHYYLSHRVDMSTALAWLEEANLKRPITERILPAVLLLRATALAARDVPDLNGFWLDDAFRPGEKVHLGVGISLRQGGLIAPAILDAEDKGLDALMADLRDLTKRARSLQLRSSEMTDATLTTTNLGDQGVESVYGIVYPPQVALVGFGKITPQPWAEGTMLGVRPVLKLTLAADHRASDGHRGGIFLATIGRYLQSPEEL